MRMSFDSDTKTSIKSDKPTRSQKAAVSALCFGAFLFLYFLMSGPLIWIEGKMKFQPFTKSLHTIYAPLVLIAKSDMKPASSIIKSYVQLFKN